MNLNLDLNQFGKVDSFNYTNQTLNKDMIDHEKVQ